jgi:hypothetical protein
MAASFCAAFCQARQSTDFVRQRQTSRQDNCGQKLPQEEMCPLAAQRSAGSIAMDKLSGRRDTVKGVTRAGPWGCDRPRNDSRFSTRRPIAGRTNQLREALLAVGFVRFAVLLLIEFLPVGSGVETRQLWWRRDLNRQ